MSEERNAYHKAWREKKTSEDVDYLRKKSLRELYKTTVEWYEKTLEKQGGHCALCPAAQFTHGKRLGVDHNHLCCPKRACGDCNRGILCATCNYRIGQVEFVLTMGAIVPKQGTWLYKAMVYLRSF